MDRYQRVEKPRAAETSMTENEIRITSQGRMRNYITYATNLLQEKGSDEISLKAMGRAINKTVMVAELIKRRIVGLHQNTSIGSTDIIDTWEPLEEGLLPLETTRHVSVLTITLSKKELDTASAGYQPPIPGNQVKPLVEHEREGGSSNLRSRGRGGHGNNRGSYNNYATEYSGNGSREGGHGYGGGRGRGRGWGRGRGSYRGRGRGYMGSPVQQDFGGYIEYGGSGGLLAFGRGHGRGRWRGRAGGRGPEPGQDFGSDGPVQTAP